MICPRLLPAAILALFALPASAAATEAAATPAPAAAPWQFEWNARLRHEDVDDDAFDLGARATTLRLRAGLRMHLGDGFEALVEGEGVASAGDEYNSGANGRTTRPAITDPEGAELNQAWIGWKNDRIGATLGRQRLLFDNQRWIGNSGWRQNEQTFDALSMQWKPTAAITARYAFIDRVHRVSGDHALDPLARERDLSTQVFNLAMKHGAQQWVGYAYLHDDRDLATASTSTYGLRWSGARLHDGSGWGWTLESARQRDFADNPLAFSHAYWLLEPTFASHGITWRAGWEHLGGNGTHALQAPLATLHAFNGWADKFLVTPPGGLDDRYIGAGGAFGRGSKCSWLASWHDFRAATDGDRYGSEWNASLAFPVGASLTGLVKLADYRSDGFARDTRKLWLQLEWAH
ncbi:alginate export family protein [Cognatiluteimonas profundi]|uniref:alginate export family protein n=1 Tax=Cognatiluteimonas profundi TaxID=2594501 RepID=UPI00131AC4B7|nr:alginate export family protein [Lysobacter profundi]